MKSPGENFGVLLLILASSHLIATTGHTASDGTNIPLAAPSKIKIASQASNPAPPVPTESRRLALEAADAFLNDGFQIRDGEWIGSLTSGVRVFLSVTLFEGVSYWFVGASPVHGAVLRLTLYDSQGKPMTTEQWKDGAQGAGSRCAAGFAPGKSGRYFVGMELLDNPGGMPVDFSVIYAYK